MSKIVVIDTETGGLNPEKHSLLTVAMVLVDGDNIVEAKEWAIIEPDDMLNFEEEAMSINGINIAEHRVHALSPARVVAELEGFVPSEFRVVKGGKAYVCGHNVHFDLGFLKRLGRLAKAPDFVENMFYHRVLDTGTIISYLYLNGTLKEWPGTLQKCCEMFHIPLEHAHTALDDAIATSKLWNALVNIKTEHQMGLF